MPSRGDDTPPRDGAILVLTEDADVTAQLVVDKLRADGEPVVLVQTSDFPLKMGFSAAYLDDRFSAQLELPHAGRVDVASIRSVWNRRPASFTFRDGLSADSLKFAQAEAKQALVGSLHCADCLWINSPQHESAARFKPLQLRIAQQVGLAIPETLITTSPKAARGFYEQHGGQVIYKRLSSASLYDERAYLTHPFTTMVTDEMAERFDQVEVTPCLFQRYVPKAVELRVTVVGEFIVAAQVDSQASADGRIDWRMGGDALSWTTYDLPDDVVLAVHRLMDRLDLVFGAIDIVVTPDGRYVFLEVNPAGQWAWFDDEITLPIRDAIAELLAAGTKVPAARDLY